DCYALVAHHNLGGIHLTERHKTLQLDALLPAFRQMDFIISAAIHQLSELATFGAICDYVLISPVFDSISKQGYQANPSINLSNWSGKTHAKLLALGGIDARNTAIALEKGFDGIASLGYIWQQPEQAVSRFHQLQQALFRPYALSIAGFDPSAGAGVLADIKTFEQLSTYGLSACTALTIQNDIDFKATQWVPQDAILAQVETLQARFSVSAVKIGLIENWNILQQVLSSLKDKHIVFDPILKASAGFDFHQKSAFHTLLQHLPSFTLLTPNRLEILQLAPQKSPMEAAKILSQYCPVLLKGGHHETRLGEDELWQDGTMITVFEPQQIAVRGKHGSGCVLSAAIAAYLAKGADLVTACEKGKEYTEHFLNSNSTLLGYHYIDTDTDTD
ncbi:MAG: bifunctional hydroxymethylpyrimidine kinase/phosphomethylpyrimidine kinase, partial [Bacteroidota bacterium]